MASQSIGVVRGALSGQIYAVVNPDDDVELDNPRLLLFGRKDAEPLMLIRVARDAYTACLSMDQVAEIVDRLVEQR